MEQVKIKCTDNGREMSVTLVNKTDDRLIVHVVASGTKLTMMWKTNQYVGNMAGLEFTSSGKTVR